MALRRGRLNSPFISAAYLLAAGLAAILHLSPASGCRNRGSFHSISDVTLRSAGLNVKVLIIEDARPVSHMLKLKIERWGHRVRVAETGGEALAMVKEEMFDLILLDIFLPDFVAYDLIPMLKEHWSGMSIITMTGHSSKDTEQRVRSHGILYYMEKPVDLDQLKSILDHMDRKSKDFSGV